MVCLAGGFCYSWRMQKQNLVFLHGFPFNGSSWDAETQHFSREHNVLAPDLRGHRGGPDSPGPWFVEHFVEDLKSLLDQKGYAKMVLCGLSMGGYVALHFAQKYPERLAGLILCDTRADPDSNEAKDKRFATLQKIQADGLAAFAEDFSRSVLAESSLQAKPDLQKKVAAMITGNKQSSVAMVLGTLASRRDSTPYLAAIRVPTLVLVGDQDKITPVEVNQVLAKAIPGARLEVIPGAGHLSNLEQPELFQKKVEEFLRANF